MNRAIRAVQAGLVAALALILLAPSVRAQGLPMIEHIEPTSGPPGTRVQIVGRNFRQNIRVLFNEHEVRPTERLPERLTVEVPQGAQSGRFVIAHGADEVESEVFRVTDAAPPPRVTAIEPTTAAPGMEVVLRGENFGASPADNQVRIGTRSLVVRSADPTTLRVIVPEGVQSGPLTVRAPGGEAQSPALTVSERVNIREFVPTGAAPGGHVVLHGSGFSSTPAQNHVTVGGHPMRVLRASATELEFEVPRDAQQGGAIVVEAPGAGRFETGAQLRVAPAPLITAIDPPQGAAGARVTLRGQRFGSDQSAVQVTLGEAAANVVTVAPTEVVVQVPRGAVSGRWSVTVGGIGPVQSPADFSVLEPVTVTAFAPRAADVGDQVTLTGTGFSTTPAQNTVHLGALQATVVSATQHQIVAQVPPGARSGQWSVAVAGNGEGRVREAFMVTLRPHITALDPPRGIVGSRVTIRGENFPADRGLITVRLAEHECAVESTSREQIVVTVPRGVQPGAARFAVVARLQGTGTSPMDFFVLVPTRITSVDPPAAPVGARVTVHGDGFEIDPHQLHVRLASREIRPASATASEIAFVVPRGAQSGELSVEAPDRQTAATQFTVQVPPVVQSFAPAQAAPGASVTIRGQNFGTDTAAVTVTLNGAACAVQSAADRAVVVQVPEGAATGRFAVSVRGQGEARAPRDFRVSAPHARH